jgi:hypothetical protein
VLKVSGKMVLHEQTAAAKSLVLLLARLSPVAIGLRAGEKSNQDKKNQHNDGELIHFYFLK